MPVWVLSIKNRATKKSIERWQNVNKEEERDNVHQAHYEHIWQYLLRHPRFMRLLICTNDVLTALGYIAFILLILLEVAQGSMRLAVVSVIVCAIGFLAVSLMRTLINAPRPYEVSAAQTPLSKETCGKSFPSRHTFSLTIIAFAWIAFFPIVGFILLAASLVMGIVRVALGVHWVRDVVCAYFCAGIFGFVLFAVCSLFVR